jgi:hypothetical protein
VNRHGGGILEGGKDNNESVHCGREQEQSVLEYFSVDRAEKKEQDHLQYKEVM